MVHRWRALTGLLADGKTAFQLVAIDRGEGKKAIGPDYLQLSVDNNGDGRFDAKEVVVEGYLGGGNI